MDVLIRPSHPVARTPRFGTVPHCLCHFWLAAALVSCIGSRALAQETASTGEAGNAVAADPFTRTYVQRPHSAFTRLSAAPNAARALVILSSNPDVKTQTALQEDLAVMYHLLDKTIDENLSSDQNMRKALGVNLVFAPDVAQLQTAYLEGYGALFLFRVNFPLLAASGKTEAPKQERQVSSAWEEARQEVFGQPGEGGAVAASVVEPYSEDKVNRLKSALLESLKNASNIRDLKPDEGVTLCVFGASQALPLQNRRSGDSSGGALGFDWYMGNSLLSGRAPQASQRGTVLTIRAQKRDIDSFAKGQINLDELRKNARVATYEGDSTAEMGFGHIGGVGFGGGYGGLGKR